MDHTGDTEDHKAILLTQGSTRTTRSLKRTNGTPRTTNQTKIRTNNREGQTGSQEGVKGPQERPIGNKTPLRTKKSARRTIGHQGEDKDL